MRTLAALLIALLCLHAGQCRAQACTVSTTPTAFGNYLPLSGSANTSNATVSVTCNSTISLLVSYSLALSTGTGGSFAARSMAGGASRLAYQLYRDSAYSQIWGDGTSATYTVTDGYLLSVLTPVTRNYTAYGRIPASQNVATGGYTDTIMVLLTY